MKIYTNSDLMAQQLKCVSLIAIKKDDMKEKVKKDQDGNITTYKKDGHGKQLFSVSGINVISHDPLTNEDHIEKGVYLSITTPVDIKPYTEYVLTGQIVIESFGNRDGGLITTIVAESLTPLQKQN